MRGDFVFQTHVPAFQTRVPAPDLCAKGLSHGPGARPWRLAFATHAMHVIPVFVSLVLSATATRRVVIVFTAVFVAFVGNTLGEALMGRPLLEMAP